MFVSRNNCMNSFRQNLSINLLRLKLQQHAVKKVSAVQIDVVLDVDENADVLKFLAQILDI